MSVHARKVTPTLLQVDAVLTRLAGAAAATEVARYVRSEFAQFRWLGIYRPGAAGLELLGDDGERPSGKEVVPVDTGIAGRTWSEGRPTLNDAVPVGSTGGVGSELAVPIAHGSGPVGVIVVTAAAPGALDATDARLLEQVGAKLIGVVAGAPPSG